MADWSVLHSLWCSTYRAWCETAWLGEIGRSDVASSCVTRMARNGGPATNENIAASSWSIPRQRKSVQGNEDVSLVQNKQCAKRSDRDSRRIGGPMGKGKQSDSRSLAARAGILVSLVIIASLSGW